VGDGEANFGVVVVFSSPLVEVGVDELELAVELFEEPQPAASTSAVEQAISVDRPPLIAFGP
jgi:hypothetical protein